MSGGGVATWWLYVVAEQRVARAEEERQGGCGRAEERPRRRCGHGQAVARKSERRCLRLPERTGERFFGVGKLFLRILKIVF